MPLKDNIISWCLHSLSAAKIRLKHHKVNSSTNMLSLTAGGVLSRDINLSNTQ